MKLKRPLRGSETGADVRMVQRALNRWTAGAIPVPLSSCFDRRTSDRVMAIRNKRGTLYALEHRVVMARYLGRPLERSETVHHINGDRSDNRLANLQLRIGRHGSGQVLKCADCGSTNLIPVELG